MVFFSAFCGHPDFCGAIARFLYYFFGSSHSLVFILIIQYMAFKKVLLFVLISLLLVIAAVFFSSTSFEGGSCGGMVLPKKCFMGLECKDKQPLCLDCAGVCLPVERQ